MLRAALLVTSLANSAAGIGLGSLYFRLQSSDGMPTVVLFVAISLFVQGAYTLGYLAGLYRRWGSLPAQLFVAGEFAAALIGSIATVQGIVYNMHPRNGDFEFGPLTAAMLMTAQAVTGLIYAVRTGMLPDGGQTADHSPHRG